jgi:uncharacterized protein YjbI with pentapeptide repeats
LNKSLFLPIILQLSAPSDLSKGIGMANPEHLEILKRGIPAWNEWRVHHCEISPDLTEADLTEADLTKADLTGADLTATDLTGADLTEADLWSAYLTDANLTNANLTRANLTDADLADANLSGATLTRANLWGATSTGATLTSADLTEANLRRATLTRANITKADLTKVDLRGATLTGANLAEANLTEANITEANLTGADLTGANLRGATLTGTNVRGAIFTGLFLGYSSFSNLDLSEVNGLDAAIHLAPSTIGIDTIYRSRGKIPHGFLKGAGLPESFIDYMATLTGAAFEYYSCFISYSSKDEEFAKRLHADLQAAGVRCWFAPEDLKIGQKIRPGLDEAIGIYDKLLLVLSKHSVGSKWVEKEVETAFDKESGGKTVLFPVRLDDAVFRTDVAWANDIRRTRQIGDFRKWKAENEYRTAFQRLLRDLKAEGKLEQPAKPTD